MLIEHKNRKKAISILIFNLFEIHLDEKLAGSH